MKLDENAERRIAELRNLAPVAPVRRGLRLENRTNGGASLYLYDAIGGWDGVQAKDIVTALNEAHRTKAQVDLYINSPGGDIFEGHAIHNAILRHPGNVRGYIDGLAASAASYVAMACDELWIMPNAQMMIHDGHGGPPGLSPAGHREVADLLDLLSDSIAQMYADRAGGEVSDWRLKMSAETWFNATQATEAGLVNGIHRVGSKDLTNLVGEHSLEPVDGPTADALRAQLNEDSPPEWFGGLTSGLKGLFA
jgi:ATP-dependent protease ClpP protease subunit